MVAESLAVSSIFLSIVCAFMLIISFLFNFTFLITLLKLRRLNNYDKSNYFLTHLIFADFFCAFFILIPSGYGAYSTNLEKSSCHLQVYFITFYFSITFYGMLALSIERFYKYKYPIGHVHFFTNRYTNLLDENGEYVQQSKKQKYIPLLIILAIWLLNIFIAFIPMFANFNDLQYFSVESQCDYQYENFIWWLWLYFWVSLTIPFLVGLGFFMATLRLIYANAVIINGRLNEIREKRGERRKRLNYFQYAINLIFPCFSAEQNYSKEYFQSSKAVQTASDTTRLPENYIYYNHLINVNTNQDSETSSSNDMHLRKQLLIQFKYDTEKSKTATFLLINIISYMLVFPLFVIHFYRSYNTDASYGSYDNPNVVRFSTYTAFAWISYITLVVKSLFCLLHNKFYRYSLYQSANCRGFHGIFEYEKKRLKKDLEKLEDHLNLKHTTNDASDS